MFTILIEQFKIALRFLFILTIITGIIYPAIVTLIAQGIFPWRANGSIIALHGKKIGSHLIGQYSADEKYFWSRPSATTRYPYDAENSSGSNLALSNPRFITAVKERVEKLHRADPQQSLLIPSDLVTASASGLDPNISFAAALYQVPRIARVRQITEKEVNNLVHHCAHQRALCLLGEPRVNVLELNLALDHLQTDKVAR
jgi:K+-transporting ATPase ATPase C chain